jgi:decaprenyl-phosphate phosphoribosyltransferase
MKRFCDLDPEDFHGTTVFLDIDGTLVPDGEETLAPAEAQTLAALTKTAHVYLLASKGYHRIPALAKAYGAEAIVTDFMKPSKRIIEGVAVPRHSRFVIGDKVMTDGWFSSRIGARFVRVARLVDGSESTMVSCLYAADALIWATVSAWNALTRSTFWLYVQVARPPQWRKNLLMLLPVAFGGALFNHHALVAVLFGIIAFSASASVSYVINDVIDCELDARHPAKRHRPIACGLIPVRSAIIYAVFLAGVAIAAAAEAPAVIPWVMAYLILTHVYTFYLKRFPVVELFAVSGFYILRLLGGGAAAGVPVSPWLILLVFFGSLLAATGGRYAESRRPYPHAIVKRYPGDFLKLLPIFCAMLTVFTYAVATLTGAPGFFWTNPLVLFAVVWYLRSVYRTATGITAEEHFWDSLALFAVVALLITYLVVLSYPTVL